MLLRWTYFAYLHKQVQHVLNNMIFQKYPQFSLNLIERCSMGLGKNVNFRVRPTHRELVFTNLTSYGMWP